MAPLPEAGPSKVCFIFGSSLAHGDHFSQLWKSFTCKNMSGGGAATVALRVTRYSGGCNATTIRNSTMTTRRPRTILLIISKFRFRMQAASSDTSAPHDHRRMIMVWLEASIELAEKVGVMVL